MAIRVVRRTLLGIRQDAVGFGRFLEFLLGLGVARIPVGVVLKRQFAPTPRLTASTS